MISVLIPVYNYDVKMLVKQLHQQLIAAGIPFEIICLEDGSNEDSILQNAGIRDLNFTSHFNNEENLGRTQTRQNLAAKAKYKWLLFLDADVIPSSDDFIKNYLGEICYKSEAIFGGLAYKKESLVSGCELRWNYGRQKEQVKAEKRNNTPFKVITSANFLIKKNIFRPLNEQMTFKGYGLDNYFGNLLKTNQISVRHIDNEVYHLGLETNSVYLRKKEKAAETLLSLHQDNKIVGHQNDLLRLFEALKKYRLTLFFSLIHDHLNILMKKNLFGKKPSIKLLQLYKISYLCYIYEKS